MERRERREYLRAWRAANPEREREYSRRAYAKNPERARAAGRKWYAADPQRAKSYKLKRLYGITLDEWNAIFVAQGSKCSICSATTPGSRKGWHTDHDHETNELRGILCHGCNFMVGYAKDNSATLAAAATYLGRAA